MRRFVFKRPEVKNLRELLFGRISLKFVVMSKLEYLSVHYQGVLVDVLPR